MSRKINPQKKSDGTPNINPLQVHPAEPDISDTGKLSHSFMQKFATEKDLAITTKSAAVLAELTAQESFGRYQIIDEIGRGGMGIVYAAYDQHLKRKVALKLLAPENSGKSESIERFWREARATAKLHHPNIVTVHDMGNYQGYHFLSMDLIEGQSLRSFAKNCSPTIRQIVAIVKKISKAIHYAHSRGVIHRDIKPTNILIDRDCEPKVMDFGLAKVTQASKDLSRSGMVIGTLQYMPPEQADGRLCDIDAQSDVYSLGATLYELLCGRPPFTGKSSFQLVYQIMREDPLCPTKIKKKIPPELAKICLKALAKKKRHRYVSAQQFANDLERFLHGRKINQQTLAVIPLKRIAAIILAGIILASSWSMSGREKARQVENPAHQISLSQKAEKHFIQALYCHRKANYSRAWQEVNRACLLFNDARYQIYKALMLYRGKGVTAAPDSAAKIVFAQFGRISEKNDSFSFCAIGQIYLYGIGIAKDHEKAATFFSRAMHLGNDEATYYLGWMSLKGLAMPKDDERAASLFSIAAGNGQLDAMLKIASMYKHGRGVPLDYSKALQWYHSAAREGFDRAYYQLGILYLFHSPAGENIEEAQKWFIKAAEKGNDGAMVGLGYIDEQRGDLPGAIDWYRKAAASDNPTALNNLGVLYRDGRGVSADYQRALDFFQRASHGKKVEKLALINAGGMYYEGRGIAKNHQKAVLLFEQAYASGIYTTAEIIGDIYEQGGYGVVKNRDKARAWYEKAQGHGNARAAEKLRAMKN